MSKHILEGMFKKGKFLDNGAICKEKRQGDTIEKIHE